MGAEAATLSCFANRWNGLVETSDGGDETEAGCWGGEVAEEDVAVVAASLACCICLKNGFFEPESVEEATGSDGAEGGLVCEAGADAA